MVYCYLICFDIKDAEQILILTEELIIEREYLISKYN